MTVKVILSQPGIAFATLVDNKSTDSAVYLGKRTAKSWVVPVVAHIPGKDNTLWSSSVTLWNGNSANSEIELEYLPANTDNLTGGVAAAPFLLGGYDTFSLDDVLRKRFGIHQRQGRSCGYRHKPITVTSRVWTDGANGGTSGNGVRTVHKSELVDGEVVLPGVRMLNGFRTNVGVVTGEAWATVEFRLRDADGIVLAQEVPRCSAADTQTALDAGPCSEEIEDLARSGGVACGNKRNGVPGISTVIDGTSQDPLFVMAR